MNLFYKLFSLAFCLLLSKAFAAQPLRIGTVPFDPPYVFSLSQGFEIDLMQLICKGMKTTCTFVPMRYNELFIQLNEQKIDLAMDGLDFYVNKNPLNGPFIYSLPYLLSKGQLLIQKKNSATKITELPSQAKVGIVREQSARGSGVFFDFFEKKYGDKFKLVQFASVDRLIAALGSEEITAAFLDNNQANYWILNGNGIFKALGDPMKVADGIGIAANPSSAALIAQVNQQLQEILNSSQYVNLYNTYIGTLPK